MPYQINMICFRHRRSVTGKINNRIGSGEDRLSFPLFYDPDFTAHMDALPLGAVDRTRKSRRAGFAFPLAGTFASALDGH